MIAFQLRQLGADAARARPLSRPGYHRPNTGVVPCPPRSALPTAYRAGSPALACQCR